MIYLQFLVAHLYQVNGEPLNIYHSGLVHMQLHVTSFHPFANKTT